MKYVFPGTKSNCRSFQRWCLDCNGNVSKVNPTIKI